MKQMICVGLVSGCVVSALFASSSVQAQVRPTFSIDMQSVTAGGPGAFTGTPDSWAGTQIDEGSILTASKPGPIGPNVPQFAGGGVLPVPGVMVTAFNSGLGSIPGGLGIHPGVAQEAVELDALSYGHDYGIELMFSVDEWAGGDFLLPPAAPNVFSEGVLTGVKDAAADVFRYRGKVERTATPPVALRPGNQDYIDGNGLPSPAGPIRGLGLIEPMSFGCGFECEGDNLDALDINTLPSDFEGLIYFSLDSEFPDPLDGPLPNAGTAPGNGFSGADVLASRVGGTPFLYAPAALLGLDREGEDTDDLDALILQENGDGQFNPDSDRILFSVRRGSAVIGQPDSLYGIPIEEGDVLSLPIPGGPGTPSIYIAAEALGLGTVRSGTNELTNYGDELDALDLFLKGDLNGDGFVGLDDLDIVLNNWNKPVPPADPAADPTGDGFVGLADLDVVLMNWNAGAPLPPLADASVPEPATLAFMGLAGFACLRRR